MAGFAMSRLDHKLMLSFTFAAAAAALRLAAAAASVLWGCFAALSYAVASLRISSASAPVFVVCGYRHPPLTE